MHLFINIDSNPINESEEKFPKCDLSVLVPVHFSCDKDKTRSRIKKNEQPNHAAKEDLKRSKQYTESVFGDMCRRSFFRVSLIHCPHHVLLVKLPITIFIEKQKYFNYGIKHFSYLC